MTLLSLGKSPSPEKKIQVYFSVEKIDECLVVSRSNAFRVVQNVGDWRMKTKGLRPAATSQHRVHQTIFADGRELRFMNNDRNGNDLFSIGHGQVDKDLKN